MPQPVPTSRLYSFSTPVVKGSDLILPVLVGVGHPHGLRASLTQWRAAALAIVAATEPAALQRARISESKKPDERFAGEDARAPVAKPGGALL